MAKRRPRVRPEHYVPNHKEREYRACVEVVFRGLTPERVANSVSLMLAPHRVIAVRDVETGESVEFVGRCFRCQGWIRQTDKYAINGTGMECGDCRPGGCYGPGAARQ